MPEHVFVETNFVVDWAAPAHLQVPAAVELVDRAARGELVLHVPAICLDEARPVLQSPRFQPRHDTDPIRQFLASAEAKVGQDERTAMHELLSRYESFMKKEVREAPARVAALRSAPGVHVFAADDEILRRTLSIGPLAVPVLKPFDLCVLASVLVEAQRIRGRGDGSDLSFCERDTDLQPWDNNGDMRPWLTKLYDDAEVWVYGDFTRSTPERPPGWPR